MLHGHMAYFKIAVQCHASSVTGTWAIGGATRQTDEYCVRNLAGGVMSAQFSFFFFFCLATAWLLLFATSTEYNIEHEP